MSEPAASLLDLDLGFLALPRRLCSSPFYQSLPAAQRQVITTMLLLARHSEGGEFYFAGKRIPLAPGQFIETEETIARVAGTTRRVVRRAIERLEDVGEMVHRPVHPSGQCPTVKTLVNYERIRYAGGEPGQRTGQRTGQSRARGGPTDGPTEGPHTNNGNPGNKETTKAGRPARAGATGGGPAGFREDLEKLRAELERHLKRRIGGPGTNARHLEEQLDRLGFDLTLEAAKEIDAALIKKGRGPLRSLAALPGWLKTVEPEHSSLGHSVDARRGRAPVGTDLTKTLEDV